MFELPPDLQRITEALATRARPRLVGGWVRDRLRGEPATDFDIEVAGIDFPGLVQLLEPFGRCDLVGKAFATVKLRTAEQDYDFSLPRRESRVGQGHRGFQITPDPQMTDREAAARRDFTINAIAYDPVSRALIDPFDGQGDLRRKVLRHTSEAFAEDPLRVLRGMQLAGRFDLALDPATAVLSRSIADRHAELPVERIWGEWFKWAAKSTRPSRGLAVLRASGWDVHYPELHALQDTPQEPDWHPEGDVWVHTGHCLDALATDPHWLAESPTGRARLMFAVLAHDFGKPATTVQVERRGQLRWSSPRHEKAGVPLAESFLRRIGAPLNYAPFIGPLVHYHLMHHHGERPTRTAIRRLARKLSPATVTDLAHVMRADARGRPPRDPEPSLELINTLLETAETLRLADQAPRQILHGRHLVRLGLKPGPTFTEILRTAFEAQLDGAFNDESEGEAWLALHLRRPNS